MLTPKQAEALRKKAARQRLEAKLSKMIEKAALEEKNSIIVSLTDTEVSILRETGYKVKRAPGSFYEVIMP